MADWSLPTSGTAYTSVLTDLNGKDVDAITLQVSAPSNLPTGAIAWDRSLLLFKEWGGSSFANLVLAIAGGGTGAATAAGARTALGLGDMATQVSSSVAITGGTISGVTLNASTITAGQIALARGGTGASLSLGSSGYVLQSNGSAVAFGIDGSKLVNLNASNISSGTVPTANLPPTIPRLASKSGDFSVDFSEDVYFLTGTHVITLPTVVGSAGLRVTFIIRDTGSWTINTNGAETLLGVTSYPFNWGQYASITIQADGTSVWDVL